MAAPSAQPHEPKPFSRALLLAVMVTVLYGSILGALFGVISLVTDTDVIRESDAGPLVGLALAGTSLVVVFFSILGGLKPTGTRSIPVGRALITGALCYLASPLAGAVMYALGQPQLGAGVNFYLRYLISPFVGAAAVAALLTVVLLPWINSARSAAR